MGIYEGFASFYTKGIWADYSRRMADLFPDALKRFSLSPGTLLDVACGEGTFAASAARMGFEVTGVDLSEKMLELAREKARRGNLDIEFVKADMRELPFRERFDLVTCWFDSLNYLLDGGELEKTFAAIRAALKPQGHFIFDMNTVYGLASYCSANVSLSQEVSLILLDTKDIFVINRPEYDFEKNIATWRLTGFEREGKAWCRMDEEHRERGYSLDEIAERFLKVGFKELSRTDLFPEIEAVRADSKRVWFVLRKQ